jgi:hypothetical protein
MAAPRGLFLSDIPALSRPRGLLWSSRGLLVATQGGRERTAAEYGALLGAAGFARPEVRRMQNLLEHHCVVGWKA